MNRYQQSERRRLERTILRFKKAPKADIVKRAAAQAAAAAAKATETKDGQPVITVSERDARAERKAAAKLARDAGEEIKIPILDLQSPLTGKPSHPSIFHFHFIIFNMYHMLY
jgi:hypothetical protein